MEKMKRSSKNIMFGKFYLIIIFIIFCFKNSYGQIKVKDTIFVERFESHKWRKDSIACFGYRSQVYEELILNTKSYKGQDEKEMLDLLGKPNFTNSIDTTIEREARLGYFYYVTKGIQCEDSTYDGGGSILFYFFSDSKTRKVKSLGIMIP